MRNLVFHALMDNGSPTNRKEYLKNQRAEELSENWLKNGLPTTI